MPLAPLASLPSDRLLLREPRTPMSLSENRSPGLPTVARIASIAVAVAAIVLTHASDARADESEAERMFREGRALMLQSRFGEACPMLEESQRLEPHVGTLLNVAACHERQGRIGSAWVEYQKALTAARAEGQKERARLAEERIKVLEPNVPWLRITSSDEGLTLALDGSALAHAAWRQEMPVDAGAHVVTATRDGTNVFEVRVELKEGEHRTVAVEPREIQPLPGATAPLPAEPERVIVEPKPAEAAPPAAPRKHANPWVAELGLFLGVLGGKARYTAPLTGVALTSQDGREQSSCASRTCSVNDVDGGGVAPGVSLFAGYAFGETVHLGARLLLAPSLGNNGASATVFGPAVTLHPSEALTLGAWAMYGDASLSGNVTAGAPTGYVIAGGNPTHVEAGLGGALGLGVELSIRLFELKRGEVLASTTPFFLSGSNGNVFGLPVGLAYRFQ